MAPNLVAIDFISTYAVSKGQPYQVQASTEPAIHETAS
jgi:hypothetical protein